MREGFILALLAGLSCIYGQRIGPDAYWIYFTDKDNNGYEINMPEAFLSVRSIDRRGWQGLAVDVSDMPVSGRYVDSLKRMGIEVVHVSRWLNGAAVRSSDPDILEKLYNISFIDSKQWQSPDNTKLFPSAPAYDRFGLPLEDAPDFEYGYSREQVELIGMNHLHQKGYTGAGVYIAVLDAGFRNVDSVPSFEKMISEGRLIDTINFVNKEGIFRMKSSHGMNVLSIMGAEWNYNLIGTAPHASYMLCTSENPYSEYPIEEIAWIAAAELADSLGFDVINTSLGYSVFDDSTMNYSYEDMDGTSTYISRAASMVSGKGMISVNSAGNAGNSPWYYITAPADAANILTVGAVDSLGILTGFSSRGPTYDRRIKPDVVGMGSGTAVQYFTGVPARGGGTSFSSPLIAGAVASLWQAFPELSAEELIKAVLKNSDRSWSPDSSYGYGIPDFFQAYYNIEPEKEYPANSRLDINPNPASSRIWMKSPEETNDHYQLKYTLEYYDLQGRLSFIQEVFLPGEIVLPSELVQGIYILQIRTENGIYYTRLIKN